MKTLKIILIFIIGLIITNCSDSTKPDKILNYTIIKDDIYEIPIKTQVQLDVLVSDSIVTEQNVRDLLTLLYDKTAKRTGFKYHDNPTNIYIYLYSSKEKSESGMAQWIGMISKNQNDSQPNISIDKIQLNSLKLKSSDKFGFSEDTRLKIWNKIIKNEDKAQKEANLKYPLDNPGVTNNDFKNNGDLNNKLKAKYEKELANEYNISVPIIDSIALEGLTKGWPFPKY